MRLRRDSATWSCSEAGRGEGCDILLQRAAGGGRKMLGKAVPRVAPVVVHPHVAVVLRVLRRVVSGKLERIMAAAPIRKRQLGNSIAQFVLNKIKYIFK